MLMEPHLLSNMKRFFIQAIAQFPGFLLNSGLIIYFSIFRNFYSKPSIVLDDLKNSRFYYKNYMNYKSKKKEAICI